MFSARAMGGEEEGNERTVSAGTPIEFIPHLLVE
jgi:hypothetical protein